MCTKGFTPCRAEPNIWLHPADDHCEHVTVHVDNLAFAVDKHQEFVTTLCDKHNFKLKGTGPITCHLGASFIQDLDGTLSMSPKKCIVKQMATNCLSMFGEKPKT